MNTGVSKDEVKKAVKKYEEYLRIDPTMVNGGHLGVKKDWTRLSMDVLHHRNIPYFSMVDCGPGRFAMWRKMRGDSATEVCWELENIFFMNGSLSRSCSLTMRRRSGLQS